MLSFIFVVLCAGIAVLSLLALCLILFMKVYTAGNSALGDFICGSGDRQGDNK
jgi:hypothetical protein